MQGQVEHTADENHVHPVMEKLLGYIQIWVHGWVSKYVVWRPCEAKGFFSNFEVSDAWIIMQFV